MWEDGTALGNVSEAIYSTAALLEATKSAPVNPLAAHEERKYAVDSIVDHDKKKGVR